MTIEEALKANEDYKASLFAIPAEEAAVKIAAIRARKQAEKEAREKGHK